jgi:hypothetical protein
MDRPEARELRKNVSRETSQREWVSERGWRKRFHVKHRPALVGPRTAVPFYAGMFHVKQGVAGSENTILQNNPMH